MTRSLYFECASGISGDMTVAALLDLGADREALKKALDSIPAAGFRTEISRVKKSGIDCCDFRVCLDEAHENHDHDMAYLHGHERGQEEPGHAHGHGEAHAHGQEHHHDDGHGHDHGHAHEENARHEAHDQHHAHRHLAEIHDIIDRTDLTDGARALAKKIFGILAGAEAKAHGLPVEEVHFHEVGALDSIVDIIAIAVCFDSLKISDVIVKSVTEGTGTVRCQHGILPVPVPAVANIAERYALPLRIADVRGEFVTPTGAAFLAAVMTADRLPEGFRIARTGLGAGKREYALPSILRAMIVEAEEETSGAKDHNLITCDIKQENAASEEAGAHRNDTDVIYKLETDIDDSTGEELGLVEELLLAAGAREVHFLPIYMKKNRPAYELVVLCTAEQVAGMECILFRHTTTIGIRRCPMERTILSRREVTVTLPDAPGRSVRVKVCGLSEGNNNERYNNTRYYPEYDDVAAVARAADRPFREIYAKAVEAAQE